MKSIVVSFDLAPSGQDEYRKAYKALSDLGLSPVAQDVLLPNTTVVGTWYNDLSTEQIRGVLIDTLMQAGAKPTALIVVAFVDCAWWRSA